MKAGEYRADCLLPGDRLAHGAEVLDCEGDGSHVRLYIRRADGSKTMFRLRRDMKVPANVDRKG